MRFFNQSYTDILMNKTKMSLIDKQKKNLINKIDKAKNQSILIFNKKRVMFKISMIYNFKKK